MYLSLLRNPSFSLPAIPHSDKAAHMLMYLVLSLCFTYALLKTPMKRAKLRTAAAIVIPTVYGGAIELLQEWFFYPRTGTWGDWAADITGVLIGYFAIILLQKWKTNASMK